MAKQTPTRPPPEHFPLDSLEENLKKFDPPKGNFDPNKPWRQTYGVYSIARIGKAGGPRTGRLTLARRAGQDGKVAIDVGCDRQLIGGRHKVAGAIEIRPDSVLSAPASWRFDSRLLDPAGKTIAQTRMTKTGLLKDGEIRITSGKAVRKIKVSGPCTTNWSLFDAVQRLPREKTKPQRFTLIDHFDQIKPGYLLSYRNTIEVSLGGRKLRLVAYDQVGRGNVPWVYWLDGRGRLLFIVAGLEAYVLESSEQS